MICLFSTVYGQERPRQAINPIVPPVRDSLPTSGTATSSSSSLGGDLTYYGRDTIIYSRDSNTITLYGAAWVKFESYELNNSDKITIYMDRDEAVAEYLPGYFREEVEEEEAIDVDTLIQEIEEPDQNDPFAQLLQDSLNAKQDTIPTFSGKNPLAKPGIPHFTDGSNQFDAKKMRYNFKTKKGMVYDAVTEQQSLFIHGGRTKVISEGESQDSLDNTIFASHTLITSCNAEVPHFGIRSSKQKIVPGKEVIVGPSHLEIEGIPTPLWLPFGFYPMTTQPKSGLIIPSGYEYSPTHGFGLRNFGYYFPINDHIDAKVVGEIYFRGKWGINLSSNYKVRYKYQGKFSFDYQDLNFELPNSVDRQRTRSFRVTWSHSQDAASNPFSSFSTSVNFMTANHDRNNYNDFASVTDNTASSSINYRRRFGDSPFSINISANSSQNFNEENYSLTLPSIALKMKTIFPFKKRRASGEKWYDIISLNYSSQAKYAISDTVASFFEQSPARTAKSGVRHQASTSAAFKVLKYINVSPSINLSQDWYFNTLDRTYNPELGQEVLDTMQAFSVLTDLNTSVSLNTVIYNTILRNKGYLRGYRHIMRPNLSLSYAPDNSNSSAFGYIDYIDTLGREIREDYDRFFLSPLSNPSISRGNFFLSYSLINNFEAKVRTKRDTIDKRMKLLNNLNFGGSIDLNKDSLHFSDLRYSANMNLYKTYVRTNFSGSYSFYTQNEDNRVIDKFYWEDRNLPLRFVNFDVTVNSSIRINQLLQLFTKDKSVSTQTIFDNFSLQHLFRYSVKSDLKDDKNDIYGRISNNNLSLRGTIDLSPKWRIIVGNVGYNFVNDRITYPDFTVERDLHCWAFNFRYQPVRGTFLFNIYVKEGGPLSFLKIPYQKNYQDATLPF